MATEREISYKVKLAIGSAIADTEKLKRALEALNKAPGAQSNRAAVAQIIENEKRLTAQASAESRARLATHLAEMKEREQKARATAAMMIEQERRLTSQIKAEHRLRAPQSNVTINRGLQLPGNLVTGLAGGLAGGFVGGIAIDTVERIGRSIVDFSKLSTEVRRTNEAFVVLSGGADEARSRLQAIQEGSGGTVDQLQAMTIANKAASLGLANTAQEFERVTRFATVASRIFGGDVAGTLDNLAAAASNLSFERLDQMGISSTQVRERMAELRAETSNLGREQAFLQAALEVGERTFGALADSSLTAATGVERLKVAISDARTEAAKGPIGIVVTSTVNGVAGDVTDAIQQARVAFGSADAQAQRDALEKQLQRTQTGALATVGRPFNSQYFDDAEQLRRDALNTLNTFEAAVAGGADGLEKYREDLRGIIQDIINWGEISEQQAQRLDAIALSAASALAVTNADDFSGATERALAAIEAQRDAAQEQVDAFKQIDILIARADEFTPSQLPGADKIRDQLIALKIEMASGAQVTEDQIAALNEADRLFDSTAAAVNFLSNAENAAAIATGDLNSGLASVPSFLDAVRVAALQAASALQSAFAIEAQATGGLTNRLSGLVGRGLINAQQAEQIYNDSQLAARQGAYNIATSGGTATQQQLAQAELQYQLEAPVRALEEAERLRIEADRKAAQEAERAFKGAAKSAGQAFEDVASDLRSIPGLFGTTDVTAEDMERTKLGIYQPKGDEWLRRLRDEVKNGVDHEDVSIEQAREALSRIGVQAAESAEGVLLQIEEMWDSGALFADEANLSLFDEEAVKAQLDLQQKAREGQENIIKHFGGVVDGAVAAVTGGPGAAGTGITYPIQAPSPEMLAAMQPVQPDLANLEQTIKITGYELPDNLGSTLSTGITAQIAAQMDSLKAQGSLIGLYHKQGYTDYDRTGMIDDLRTDMLTQLVAQQDYFKGHGALAGIYQKQGYAEYDRTGMVDDLRTDVLTQIVAQKDYFLGQGQLMAIYQKQGFEAYQWDDSVAQTVLSNLDTHFFSKENKEIIDGTGKTIAGYLALGMMGYDFEEAAKHTIWAMGRGFTTEDNTNILMGQGRSVANIMRAGIVDEIGQPGWAAAIASQLTTAVLDAMADSLEAGG